MLVPAKIGSVVVISSGWSQLDGLRGTVMGIGGEYQSLVNVRLASWQRPIWWYLNEVEPFAGRA